MHIKNVLTKKRKSNRRDEEREREREQKIGKATKGEGCVCSLLQQRERMKVKLRGYSFSLIKPDGRPTIAACRSNNVRSLLGSEATSSLRKNPLGKFASTPRTCSTRTRESRCLRTRAVEEANSDFVVPLVSDVEEVSSLLFSTSAP